MNTETEKKSRLASVAEAIVPYIIFGVACVAVVVFVGTSPIWWPLSRIFGPFVVPRLERRREKRDNERRARLRRRLPEIVRKYDLRNFKVHYKLDPNPNPKDFLDIELSRDDFIEVARKFKPEPILAKIITDFDEGPYGWVQFAASDENGMVINTSGTLMSLGGSYGIIDKLGDQYAFRLEPSKYPLWHYIGRLRNGTVYQTRKEVGQ